MQAGLFDAPLLPGLSYAPEAVTPDEEAMLIARINALPLSPFRFQGWIGKRLTLSLGWSYDFDKGSFGPSDPIPEWLGPLKAKAAAFAGIGDRDLVQALLIRYDPGAGIGWHRDRPEYGKVVGVSFGSACLLRLRRRQGDQWIREKVLLEPRSAYLLDGEVRDAWQHSITPAEHLRYSVTFRTFR